MPANYLELPSCEHENGQSSEIWQMVGNLQGRWPIFQFKDLSLLNSLPVYPSSPVFTAFARKTPINASVEEPLVQDHFLNPKLNLSSKQAMQWFLSGLALAMAGRWTWRGLFAKGEQTAKTELASFETNNILRNDPKKRDELNISQAFQGALDSIYRLAHLDPTHRKTLLAYLGSGMIGYVSGNVAQGAQETWVRREETRIRARLINSLQDSVQQSIRNKHHFDNQLREQTRADVLKLLQNRQVHQAEWFVRDVLTPMESLDTQRNYFYQPTSRRIYWGGDPNAQKREQHERQMQPDDPLQRVRLQKGIILALGALTGWAIHSLTALMKTPIRAALFEGDKILYETVHIKDKEAWWVNGMKSPRNLLIMGGFFGISALAKAGQLLIEGLREIEVTRINAQTELSYQTHNWLSQDPAFHEIAEREAVQNDLQRLTHDLPMLQTSPMLLRERIQTILGNVGRNSAPPYYSMTPPVSLVMARA